MLLAKGSVASHSPCEEPKPLLGAYFDVKHGDTSAEFSLDTLIFFSLSFSQEENVSQGYGIIQLNSTTISILKTYQRIETLGALN